MLASNTISLNNPSVKDEYSNLDPTGVGVIATAVAGITKSVSDAVTGVAVAKNTTKQHQADDAANVAMAKEARSAELSHTTQDLIKANAAKAKDHQKTQMIVLVVTVLIFAVFAYVATKE